MAGRPIQGFHPIHSVGQPASGPSQTYSRAHPWHQTSHDTAGSRVAMEDADSTEVVYKIPQWSLPGAAVVPVLNVSSRVFWLELDDKALLDSYTVLQEGILCDVFSQKCSAAWQDARRERLTVAIMLPGRQDADDWLNFMLSQKKLWPTFTTRDTLTEEVSAQVFSREWRRLQAKHLWMEVKLRWRVLADRMYTRAPTGKSKEELDALLFDRAAKRNHTNCGNFTPLGSYETVAFAASMAILWVIVVLHEVLVQFTTVIVTFVFRGILAYGFGHFSWFSAYFCQ